MSSELLPAPFGPSRAVRLPPCRSRSRLSRMRRLPRVRQMLWQVSRGEGDPGKMAFSCYSVRRLLTKSQMKKGAPSRAVMMPTGISAGASRVRASMSAPSNRAAPSRALSGSSLT
ncbi:hypothetical protein D3C87_1396120 [compost metagenome]